MRLIKDLAIWLEIPGTGWHLKDILNVKHFKTTSFINFTAEFDTANLGWRVWNGKEFNTSQRRKAKETLPVSAYLCDTFSPSCHSPFPLCDQKEHVCVSNHSGFGFLRLLFSSVHFAGRHSYSDLSPPHLSGSYKDFLKLSLVTVLCNASLSNSLTVTAFLNLSQQSPPFLCCVLTDSSEKAENAQFLSLSQYQFLSDKTSQL